MLQRLPRQTHRAARAAGRARKGYYTDLAKWARGKGYTHLRVDGELLPTDQWPRLDRFKEHTIELPVARACRSRRRQRAARCATRSRARSSSARAWCTCSTLDVEPRRRRAPQVQRVLDQARLPVVRPQLPGARSAPVLVQLEARLVRSAASAPASQLDGLRRGAETGAKSTCWNRWLEWLKSTRPARVRRPAPESRGARTCASATSRSPSSRALPVDERRSVLRDSCSSQAAKPRSRATSSPELKSRLGFLQRGRPGLSRARPLGADALGRRSAAHPARRAARLQPARRVLRPRRADHRPASARQPRAARHARRSSQAKGNTLRRRRARRRHDPPRRPRDRPRARARAARRRGRRRGHGRGSHAQPGIGHRAAFSRRRCEHPLHRAARRSAQRRRRSRSSGATLHNLRKRRRARPARPADRRHRRVGLGQVHARARRAVRQSRAAASASSGERKTPSSSAAASINGWRADRPRARSRPDADRQDAALVPGHLRRLLGRRSAGSSPTRPRRACAATPRAASRSTPRAAAARAAKARACKTIEMSFLPDVQGAVRSVRRRALQRRDARRALRGQDRSATCSR